MREGGEVALPQRAAGLRGEGRDVVGAELHEREEVQGAVGELEGEAPEVGEEALRQGAEALSRQGVSEPA